MVVKIINGMRIHEPPYTQAEEDEFYRRVGRARLLSRVQLVTVKRANETTTNTNKQQTKLTPSRQRPEVVPPSPMSSNRTIRT
jgi:hypothetical protein